MKPEEAVDSAVRPSDVAEKPGNPSRGDGGREMIGPPGKKKRAVGSALKGNYPITYHTPLITQSWAAEAERLAKEFLRSHQARHLQALARHLDGVFERLTTGDKT